jgi:hypothetical protein
VTLREVLALMSEYGIVQMPWKGGSILRPLPPIDVKPPELERQESEFDRFKRMSPDAQEALLRGIHSGRSG